MQRLRLFLLLYLVIGYPGEPASAGIVPDDGEIALKQSILDLKSDLTLMCLAAHPDDEDGATLAYFRKKYGMETIAVIATRGEGGQNEIGSELYRELGVIRTFETLAAGEINGSAVYYLNNLDFGYSKSAEEALRIWGHERALGHLVRLIRTLRPDVVITNHDTEHGHGHHRAVGRLILEAFEQAADPVAFPDQIAEGLSSWQIQKVYVRSRPEEATVTVPVGTYDPVRGTTFQEIANEALRQHRSQGMPYFVDRGAGMRYYRLVRSVRPIPEHEERLLDGMVDAGKLIQGASETTVLYDSLQTSIQGAFEQAFFPHHAIALDILRGLRTVRLLKERIRGNGGDLFGRLEKKEHHLEEALWRALDLRFDVEVDDTLAVRKQNVRATLALANYGALFLRLQRINWDPPEGWRIARADTMYLPVDLPDGGGSIKQVAEVRITEEAPFTVPYADHLYDPDFPALPLRARVVLEAEGVPFQVERRVKVDVAPTVAVRISPERALIPAGGAGRHTTYTVYLTHRAKTEMSGEVRLRVPEGWTVQPSRSSFRLVREDEETSRRFEVEIPGGLREGDEAVLVEVQYGDGRTEARSVVRVIPIEVAQGLRVGYVQSYDTTLEEALTELGVGHQALSPEDLRGGDLSVYDTIVLDIRAYLVRPDLVANNERLLEYVRRGGNLVVMYQKVLEWNPRYAPYELVLSRDRVTVEDAPVEILVSEHPLMRWPNRIGEEDWQGWIQERGLYFPGKWSSQYVALLACGDPGEKPLTGGYLAARYGKGSYIYTSYVWYRELKILNRGGYRNFANMISWPVYRKGR